MGSPSRFRKAHLVDMRGPLFSICIPTFNRREMLCQAIRSAINQTYDNIEVVISDNASDDGTSEAVRAIADPRIRYFRNDNNIGGASNWERCVHLAKGQFFSWLQDDDLLLPHFVSTAVTALRSTEAACCFGACLQTSTPSSLADASVFATITAVDWSDCQPVPFPLSIALPLAVFESSGIPPAMAFSTEAIRPIIHALCNSPYPLYSERMPILRCAAMNGVVIAPIIGGIYRSHPGQYSREMLRDGGAANAQYQLFLQALDEIRDLHGVGLMDFCAFLAQAPDRVVERLFLARRGPRSGSRLLNETRQCVEKEYLSRDISAARHRIWRLLSDIAPPFLKRLCDSTIQKMTMRMRVGANAH